MGQRLENAKNLYMEGIQQGHAAEAVGRYTGERYTQHSAGVGDGKEGFVAFFEDFLRRNPTRDIRIARGFEDGRFVFVQATQSLNNGESRWVSMDIFDTDDARMIEHWDVIGEVGDETASGHGQVAGPTEPTDLDSTDDNKALVSEFLIRVLQQGHYEQTGEFVSDTRYVQHNPDVPDGVAAFLEFARREELAYLEIHRVIGCGGFVASLSHVRLGGAENAVIDLFRVEDGFIVEHWDVIEEIQPEKSWANSGKF